MMSDWQQSAIKRRDFRSVKGAPEAVRVAPSKPKKRQIEIWYKYKEGMRDFLGLFPRQYDWSRWKKYTSKIKAEQALKHLTQDSYYGKYYQFEIRG
jgi:hypothetical protein